MKVLIIDADESGLPVGDPRREKNRWVAYAETGERLCSDNSYEDCIIKVGLLGQKMEPVSPNSYSAELIREKIDSYGK